MHEVSVVKMQPFKKMSVESHECEWMKPDLTTMLENRSIYEQ